MSLPAPKKLNNPFEARAQAAMSAQSTPAPRPSGGSGGKLTWSERQALAKKRAEEEEVASRAAVAPEVTRAVPAVSSASKWGSAAAAGGVAVGAAAVVSAASESWEPEPEEEYAVRTRIRYWTRIEV